MNHRKFFDRAAADWDAQTEEETLIRLREIVARLAIEPGAAVLDVGTGTGVLLPLLLEERSRVVALDFSWPMLKRAQTKGYRVRYVQGDVQHLPLSAGVFDLVICNAAFPHLPDKRQALAEMGRVLKAGGLLAISHAAGRETINALHRQIGGVVGDDQVPDVPTMHRLMSEAGLSETSVLDAPTLYLATARRECGYPPTG